MLGIHPRNMATFKQRMPASEDRAGCTCITPCPGHPDIFSFDQGSHYAGSANTSLFLAIADNLSVRDSWSLDHLPLLPSHRVPAVEYHGRLRIRIQSYRRIASPPPNLTAARSSSPPPSRSRATGWSLSTRSFISLCFVPDPQKLLFEMSPLIGWTALRDNSNAGTRLSAAQSLCISRQVCGFM